MDEVIRFLSENAIIIGVCLVVVILVALIFSSSMKRQRRRLQEELDAMEARMAEQVSESHEKAKMRQNLEREEMNSSLRGMNDSIVRMMGEMSRTQQQQLDSFGGQIRAMSRTDEERMERMRSNIEEKLQQYDNQMARITQTLDDKLNLNERRLGEMRETLGQGLQLIQADNDKKLEQIRETVDEKLNSTLDKRLGESFRTVSERLEQVYKGLGEMQTLAVGVGDLKRIMTGVKTRGIWGEVQLGALLEQVLAKGQYETNVAVIPGSSDRVEYAICLPGKDEKEGKVYLPIDAKFPSEDYQRLMNATEMGDAEGTETARKALEARIRMEAKRIRDKYIDPPHTTDFAIMFLPAEGLFAEVLRSGNIVEQLQNQYRVVITGPTTLMALLNSLQMGFRTMAIERRSSEVWELLGAVKTEFGRFSDLLSRTQQRLNQASASIEDAARKTRTIQKKLQNVQELGQKEASQMIGFDHPWSMLEEGEDE